MISFHIWTHFVVCGGIRSFIFLICCFFLLASVSLVSTSCCLKGKLFLKKFSFPLALAVDRSINAWVHTQLNCVRLGMVWLQKLTYLLDRQDLSVCSPFSLAKICFTDTSKDQFDFHLWGAARPEKNHKQNQQSKETSTVNICPGWMHRNLNKIHAMAFLTGVQIATSHKERTNS